MKNKTVAEWREIVAELTAERAEQEALIAGGASKRRKHALSAHEGDEAAAATLLKVKAADDAARDKIQNLNFAIEQAQQHLDAAQALEQEAELEQQRQHVSDLADTLINLDVRIVKELRAVNALIEQRVAVVEEIVDFGARELGAMGIAQVRNDQNIIDVVYDVFSAHLGHRRTAPIGAASKFIAGDAAIFGKPVPVALPAPTPAERERRRAIDRPVSPLRQVV